MVRALRTGIMLLTLLLVVVGGTGMVSVCPCHEEIFIFSCSCHQDAAPCECHGDDVPRTGSSSPLAGHLCEHRQLEINDLTIPVPHAPLPQPYVIWQTLPEQLRVLILMLLLRACLSSGLSVQTTSWKLPRCVLHVCFGRRL